MALLSSNSLFSLAGALVGTFSQAAGIRKAGDASFAAAEHNAAIVKANLGVTLNALGRQIREVGATQRAQAGASGLQVTSKSFLAVMSDTLSDFEREIVERRNASQNEINTIIFEGESRRAAARTRATTSIISNITSLLFE